MIKVCIKFPSNLCEILYYVIYVPLVCNTSGPEVPSVNDTVVGDPLFTVPLNDVAVNGQDISLCFEIHGEENRIFNLVSDDCLSVNTRFARLTEYLNIMDSISIRAADSNAECSNIKVDLAGCTVTLNGAQLVSPFRRAGLSVRPYPDRVRVSLPNCGGNSSLVMMVRCQTNDLADPFTGVVFTADMLRFFMMRGFGLNENSHGLLGNNCMGYRNSHCYTFAIELIH